MVGLLLEKGANVDAVNINGQKPLIYAIRLTHLQSIQLLLHHGADINHQDSEGKTPSGGLLAKDTLESWHAF